MASSLERLLLTDMIPSRERIAIIGTGIAGMGCAYFLSPTHDVWLFEKNSKPGGHTNTITVHNQAGNAVPIDTGFMVFNHATYPNLCKLFEQLAVPTVKTDMSFSVSRRDEKRLTEWNGAGLNKLLGQRRNLLRPDFLRFIVELNRFNKQATQGAQSAQYETLSVRDFLTKEHYSDEFNRLYLTPMSGAIWSTAPSRIQDFPIQTLMRFFYNHGFLGLDTHHQWYTVKQGSESYAKKLLAPFQAANRVFLNHKVVSITPRENCVELCFEVTNGEERQQHTQDFDRVICASHADETLAMLATPTPLEQKLLSTFEYQYNYTQLHTDTSVMPKTKRCWASWNYRLDDNAATPSDRQATTHYWMSNLQHLPGPEQYFVSLNAEHLVNPECVLETIHYHHPIFTLDSIQAQKRLPEINQQDSMDAQQLFFAGSYFKYGFHEDAFASAVTLCEQLLGRPVW
jgi:uncharacterized protein